MHESLYDTLRRKSIRVSFQKTIGLFGAATPGIGALMGAGIYLLIGIGAQAAGSGLWLAYLTCGGLVVFSVLRRLPHFIMK